MTFPLHDYWRHHADTFDLQWIRTVDPAVPAVTLREMKDHARITQTQGDATLQRYINAATDAAEQYMNRGLVTQTWTLTLRWFADVMYLPMAAPLQNGVSTAPVVQYYDTAGVLQTLATTYYDVDTVSRPGRILRKANISWPALQSGKLGGRVVITYVVGWTDPALIPEKIKQGIRIYVSWLDADRDGMDPNGERGRQAAESCWSDQVYAIEPTQTMYGYGQCLV
jgi:uncharacterized phiE125 gp8 family phage protein